tara:strand:- start:16777 stop:17172 length:396 start_codon:yes stop_codon:yes gene_type:complete
VKKDIEIPVVKNVHIAIVQEWNDEFLSKDWNVYILNYRSTPIDIVLVVSKGYDGDRKTSIMRHSLNTLEAKTFAKIEMIQEDLFELNNEFSVTFFSEDKLFEKKYLFKKNIIHESQFVNIPLMNKEGILAE